MSHRLIDQRSLAFNRLVAEQVRQNPKLMDQVRARQIGGQLFSLGPIRFTLGLDDLLSNFGVFKHGLARELVLLSLVVGKKRFFVLWT